MEPLTVLIPGPDTFGMVLEAFPNVKAVGTAYAAVLNHCANVGFASCGLTPGFTFGRATDTPAALAVSARVAPDWYVAMPVRCQPPSNCRLKPCACFANGSSHKAVITSLCGTS